MQDTLSFFMFLLQVKDKNEETKQVQGRKQKTPCLNTHQCLWSFSVMPLYNRASGSASYITHYAHTHFYSVMWQSHSKCYRNVTSKLKPKLFPPSMLPERQTYCTELYVYFSVVLLSPLWKTWRPLVLPHHTACLECRPSTVRRGRIWGRTSPPYTFQSVITDCNRLVFRPWFYYNWLTPISLPYSYEHSIIQ